jgi:L,D-transpeptidase catalytic domain
MMQPSMFGKLSLTIGVFVTSFALSFGAIFFVKTTTFAQSFPADKETLASTLPKEETLVGNHVVVLLNDMKVELRNGTTTLASYPVISKGKPGSYYETIGGIYRETYKTPLHFSSIGHVYMPHSVHVYGNYFIHGIPYYPSGEKVSSTYSGGCVRLADEHAKIVYDFIKKDTPVIIAQVSVSEFWPTTATSATITNDKMTKLMTAIVSLEALTQDNEIITRGGEVTTRRNELPRLINEDDKNVALLYAHSIGKESFVELMNEKAKALGLSNTLFVSPTSSAITTDTDLLRFYGYINAYKSYLRSIEKTTASSTVSL